MPKVKPAKRNKKKQKEPRERKNPKLQYEFKHSTKESYNSLNYSVQFNHYLKEGEPLLFAVAGTNQVSIYECLHGGGLKKLQVYRVSDKEEQFFTCAWSYDINNCPILATAGFRGIIRIIETTKRSSTKHFFAHGQAINDLKFHPKDPNLLLSASKDYTLKLWNIVTNHCIVTFGGDEGHSDEVLSADFDIKGDRIMSCGMDHYLKLWKLNKDHIQKAIQSSKAADKPGNTYREHFPDFSTRAIHSNYVDCVRWYGNFIFSKSCENSIVCWKPGKLEDKELKKNETVTSIIREFEYEDSEIWFMRFTIDFWRKIMAVGNQVGCTYLWDLDVPDPSQSKCVTLTHPRCTADIRETAFSRDSSILICVCNDGTVWRWDRVPPPLLQ